MSRPDRYLQAAAAIPAGETRSFMEIAALAGRRGSARAAGRAMAAVDLADTTPWHRVVAADGGLAKDERRAVEQLRRLRREGSRPRAGERVGAWARRRGHGVVAHLARKVFAARDDERIGRWPPERVEGLTDEAAARARGFSPVDGGPADLEPWAMPSPSPRRWAAARPAATALEDRLDAVDWTARLAELSRRGWTRLRRLLAPRECLELTFADHRFDRSVVMAPRGFGVGEYRYLEEPLDAPLQLLRRELYERLLPVAEAMCPGLPRTLAGFWRRCRDAGQRRPSSVLLRYGAGGVNHPHQDVYGSVWFPLQALLVLSRRGRDFVGGEFLLREEWPDGTSRQHVVPATEGDLVVFGSRSRSDEATGGARVELRHGMQRIESGHRCAVGLVFHLAR